MSRRSEALSSARQGRATGRGAAGSEVLAELTADLVEAGLDADVLSEKVVELVSRSLDDVATVRLISSDGALELVALHHDNPWSAEGLRKVLDGMPRLRLDKDGGGWAEAVVTERAVELGPEQLVHTRDALPPQARAAYDELGVSALLLVPLRARGHVLGTLALWRVRQRQAHTIEEQRFVQDLADRAALAIDNAQLVERLQLELDERRQAEESLKLTIELMQQLDGKRRALVESMVHAQEQERDRIAADVHDDSIQAIAAVSLRLQTLRRRMKEPELVAMVSSIEDNIADSIARLRSLLFQLDPSALDRVGLVRALKTYLEQLFLETEVGHQVRGTLTVEPSDDLQVILYRTAQEALANVRKHANASHVVVSLENDAFGWTVSVSDDGQGFDVVEAQTRNLPGHLGMRSMRDRVELANGSVDVSSAPGEGTTLRIWVPSAETSLDLKGQPRNW